MARYITFGIAVVSALLLFGIAGGVFRGSDSDLSYAVFPDTATSAVSLVTMRSPDVDAGTSTPTTDAGADKDGDGILVVEIVEARAAVATTTMTATLAGLASPQKLLKINSDLIAIRQTLEYRRAKAVKKHGEKKGWDQNPPDPDVPPEEKQLYEEFRQVQDQVQMPAPKRL